VQRDDVLHDHHAGRIPRRVAADVAELPLGEVAALAAESQPLLDRQDGTGQPFRILTRLLEDVKGQALRSLPADSGQAGELPHEVFEDAFPVHR